MCGEPLRTSADVFWDNFNNLQVSTLQNANFIILNAAGRSDYGRFYSADIVFNFD